MPTLKKLPILLLVIGITVTLAGPASAQEQPFEPIFEINPATPAADAPVQIQIVFELPDGNSFLKSASFRIPAEYQVPNSDDIPNGDIIGDGTLALKLGALGNMNVGLCASNKSPNLPGAHATIDIAVQIGGGDPSKCSGLMTLTLTMKKFPDGQYGFDFSLPREVVGQRLDTPLQLIVNLYSVTKPNSGINPPTSGGATVIKNPREPGNYQWTLSVEDVNGRKKDLAAPTRVDAAKKTGGTGSGLKISPAAMIGGGIAAVLVIAAAIVLLRRKKTAGAWVGGPGGDYYDDQHGAADYAHPYDDEPFDSDGRLSGQDSAVPVAREPAPVSPAAGGYDPSAVDHGGDTFGSSR